MRRRHRTAAATRVAGRDVRPAPLRGELPRSRVANRAYGSAAAERRSGCRYSSNAGTGLAGARARGQTVLRFCGRGSAPQQRSAGGHGGRISARRTDFRGQGVRGQGRRTAGAAEVDMVINVGALTDGNADDVLQDIRAVAASVDGRPLKAIIETA